MTSAGSSRAEQGFPPKIEDEAVLEAASSLLVDALIEWARERGGDGRAA